MHGKYARVRNPCWTCVTVHSCMLLQLWLALLVRQFVWLRHSPDEDPLHRNRNCSCSRLLQTKAENARHAGSEAPRLCCYFWSGAVASVELARGSSSLVAQAVHANEAAMRKELELSRFSLASSGTGSTEEVEVDPEYQCPICLVRCPMLRNPIWIEVHAHMYITT